MNIVDALVVTFSLDASSYIKSAAKQREAVKQMTDAERQAAKDADEFAKKQSDAFKRVGVQVASLVAAFTLGKGIKGFAENLTVTDAATGRLARNLNMTTQQLTAWEGAAQRTGGSADGMAGTIQGLSAQFQSFALTGQSSIIPWLRTLGIQATDAQGKLRPMGDVLLDLADKLHGMDPARASFIGQQLGLDPGSINLLEQGRDRVKALLDEQGRLGLVSPDDARRADELQHQMLNLEQRFTSFGRTILNGVSPAIVDMMNKLGDWLDKKLPAFEAWLGSSLRAVVSWIEGIDWSAVWDKATALGDKFIAILHAIADWSPPAWMRTMLGLPMLEAPAAAATPERGTGGSATTQWGREHLPTWLGGNPAPSTGAPAAPSPNAGSATTEWGRKHLPTWLGGDAAPATTPGNIKPILDLIGKSEGTDRGRGYNESLAYGKWTGGDVNLTGMSLNQIDALQTSMLQKQTAAGVGQDVASTALGRYQFTRTTLRDMRRRFNMSGDEMFDPAMQDRLTAMRIQMQGGMTQDHLAQIWASLPGSSTGASVYGQGTHATTAEVQEAIRASQGGVLANDRYSSTANDNRTAHHNSSETHIGQITVNTRATDAPGVAKSLQGALSKYAFVTQANSGLA